MNHINDKKWFDDHCTSERLRKLLSSWFVANIWLEINCREKLWKFLILIVMLIWLCIFHVIIFQNEFLMPHTLLIISQITTIFSDWFFWYIMFKYILKILLVNIKRTIKLMLWAFVHKIIFYALIFGHKSIPQRSLSTLGMKSVDELLWCSACFSCCGGVVVVFWVWLETKSSWNLKDFSI